jgi:outer membrane protein OmpA-like peptidoglycan-associated protein
MRFGGRGALIAAGLIGVAGLPGAASASASVATGSGPVLGPAGIVVDVVALRRTGGHLELTLDVANHGTGTFQTSGLRTYLDQRGLVGVTVLDPATGKAGDPVGTVAACQCTPLPVFLDSGEQLETTIVVADPGGATLDVLFQAAQPVLGVPVSGAGSGVPAANVRTFRARSQALLARTKTGAAQVKTNKGSLKSIDLDTDVLFAFNSAKLNSKAASTLETVADKLKDQPSRRLGTYGHTDGKGSPSFNQKLSLKRAQAVRSALTPLLGPGWTFDVKGYGETEPIAAETTPQGQDYPAGRRLNRRVELTVLP